jgi:peptide/nickel transport system substrate-binding protein
VRVIAPTDYGFLKTLGDVMADVMQRIGMKVDYVVTDWGTLLRRRNNPAAWNRVDGAPTSLVRPAWIG